MICHPERREGPAFLCGATTFTSWQVSRVLYVGISNDIRRRVWEHKNSVNPGFTSKYRIHRLVYFESFQYVGNAIAREKRIKGCCVRRRLP